MSALKFREGDVVRNDVTGQETVVLSVRPEPGFDQRVATADGWWHVTPGAKLVLLRRPVRVGDVLRTEGGSEVRCTSESVPYWKYGFTHADGTPIEPPLAANFERVTAQLDALRECEAISPEEHKRLLLQALDEPPEPEPPEPEDYGHRAFDIAMQAQAQANAYAMQQARAQVREVLPSVEQLARALFETDDRVVAFVKLRGEKLPGEEWLPSHWARVLDIAWHRDEHGWRTEAERRAEQVLDLLRGSR